MLGGNWFMKKTRSRKSRDTVPLSLSIISILTSVVYVSKSPISVSYCLLAKQTQLCHKEFYVGKAFQCVFFLYSLISFISFYNSLTLYNICIQPSSSGRYIEMAPEVKKLVLYNSEKVCTLYSTLLSKVVVSFP